MAKTNFEELKVYQMAEKLADEIWSVVSKWNNLARDTVGKQVIRAADSIGANVAEGSGRGSITDNRRFVCMARGSLYETQHWLRRAYRRKLLTETETKRLHAIISDLTPAINGYMRYMNQASSRTQSTKTGSLSTKT